MSVNNFLSNNFLQKLERLSVLTKKPVSGHLRGQHRSKRTGSGMIFSDYRPYVDGDDTRNLDWGIYLRLDRLVMRLFEEEADRPVYIFVDVSESMNFGNPNKLEFAQTFAAAIAYVSLINHDRVSLTTYAGDICQSIPAQRGKKQIWRTMHALSQIKPAGDTNLTAGLKNFFGASKKRGLVVIVSDFLEAMKYQDCFLPLHRGNHEVFVVQVSSPQERDPSTIDDVQLVDAESGGTADTLGQLKLLEMYRTEFFKHRREIEDYLGRQGWNYLSAETDTALEHIFCKVLRKREFFR